jgi:hypothetical protein
MIDFDDMITSSAFLLKVLLQRWILSSYFGRILMRETTVLLLSHLLSFIFGIIIFYWLGISLTHHRFCCDPNRVHSFKKVVSS